MPRTFDDVAECMESTLARVGPHIVLALPLGIGKPNPANLRPCLDGMSLGNPQSRQEWLWQRLLVRELRATLAIGLLADRQLARFLYGA
jgi:hypothetical protein